MSNLKHLGKAELLQQRRSCTTYIGRLQSKVNGQQTRLEWIDHYLVVAEFKDQKCSWHGCKGGKSKPIYRLTQKLGKKGNLFACEHCAPTWVKDGSGSPYWEILKLEEPYV